MAAPSHVPSRDSGEKYYESPPRGGGSWMADRPGDLQGGQPTGARFGAQGPDQGFILRLLDGFRSRLRLVEGESLADVNEGCMRIGLKRASIFGRAPVTHDLTVAFTVWGFLDDDPPAELVELRRRLFAGISNPHHYVDQAVVVDAVPAETLRKAPRTVASHYSLDWATLLDPSVGSSGRIR